MLFFSHILFAEFNGSVGKVLDWGSKGCLFATHHRLSECIVSLGHLICCLVLVQSRKTGPDMTEKIADWVVKNQNKQFLFTVNVLKF